MFKKIIVRLPNWIGDFVMATPVLTQLRAHFPSAQISVIGPRSICELLENDKRVSNILFYSRQESVFSLARRLQQENFDLGILLTNSFSSAFSFFLARIQRRIGFNKDFRFFLLTDPIPLPKFSLHQVERYQQLLKPLFQSDFLTPPSLCLFPEDAARAHQILSHHGYIPNHPLICIHADAAYGSAKCWPEHFFRKLIVCLLEDPNLFVAILGTSSGQSKLGSLIHGLPNRALNLMGKTNIRELSAIIKSCDLLVTNDSGPMHIGAAFQTPLVALFGSTDEKITGPWGQNDAVINKHASCAPCFRRKCPSDFRCMHQISVEDVLEKINSRVKQNV